MLTSSHTAPDSQTKQNLFGVSDGEYNRSIF